MNVKDFFFFFFAVDTGTALLLLVSAVCLWGNHLLATARPETTGVQTGSLLILWLWTISCSFVCTVRDGKPGLAKSELLSRRLLSHKLATAFASWSAASTEPAIALNVYHQS